MKGNGRAALGVVVEDLDVRFCEGCLPHVDQGLGIDGAVEGDLEGGGLGRDAIDRD